MAGWHHWLDGHGFGWTPGVGDGQGGLACCDSWGLKESDTTEWLNWTDICINIHLDLICFLNSPVTFFTGLCLDTMFPDTSFNEVQEKKWPWGGFCFFPSSKKSLFCFSACVCVLSHFSLSDSVWPYGPQPTRLLCPWNFPGKNTGGGCHFLLQVIFPTRDRTRVSCISRGVPHHWATWEAPLKDLCDKFFLEFSPRKFLKIAYILLSDY